jgi:hypothetical protein
MKSVSTMLIEEVHSLSYASGACRIVLRSVTDEDISEAWQLPPGTVKLELVCTGERAQWYLERLGSYVTMELRKVG